MGSVFTKIINKEIPSYKIAEDKRFYAFLDINPLAKGHALVIPKLEVDYIFDLPDKELADLHLFAKRCAKAIESVIPCKRVGVAVLGLEVPHAHIHLIPITKEGDMVFTNPRLELTKDEFATIAEKISKAFE